MSSTRYAPSGSPLSPKSYASSGEAERGLPANLVALRTAQLENPADAALIWSLQAESHRFGLEAVADAVLSGWPKRKATPEQIAKHHSPEAEKRYLQAVADAFFSGPSFLNDVEDYGRAVALKRRAEGYYDTPDYDWSKELQLGWAELPESIAKLCLDSAIPVADGWPHCFPSLIATLRERQESITRKLAASFPHTELSRVIWNALDDARHFSGTILLHNPTANGKSYAAKTYCDARPGLARYCQVPATNDVTSFFRAIAASLGMASGLSWKAVQMRDRIQRVLQTRQLLLVLDGAQWLFPVSDYRYALPERVNWLLTACSEFGVPIALIGDTKLFDTLGFVEMRTGWSRRQFVNQLHRVIELPNELSREDVELVAGAILPDGDRAAQRKLADYMTVAPGYLHAGTPAALRARHIAAEHGRPRVILQDMTSALDTCMIPSLKALDVGMKRADQARDKSRAKGTRNFVPKPEGIGARRPSIICSGDLTPTRERLAEGMATPLHARRRTAAGTLQPDATTGVPQAFGQQFRDRSLAPVTG